MIIGLSGLAGAGKDTVADLLCDRGLQKVTFADPMKEFCRTLFGFTQDQLYGPSESRNAIDPVWLFSPRQALQTLGTEWGRTLHKDVWVRYAIRRALLMSTDVVIPDVRFQNELSAIRQAGGEVWRIVRPGAGLTGAAAAHSSENSVQDGDCDRVILNDGSLYDLSRTIDQVRL